MGMGNTAAGPSGRTVVALDLDPTRLGITRHNVIQVCREAGIPVHERAFSLTDVYSAQESFVTGTFAGVAPVTTIDGRKIGPGERGPVTARLQELYQARIARDCAAATLPS